MSAGEMTGAHTPPPRTRTEIAEGVRMSLAAGLGMFPLGIAFGLLVAQAGLPWWMAPALSLIAYAGSLEFLLVGLITAATPLVTIAVAAFFVNFRHVFYAFSLPLHAVKNPLARLYSKYALTDETFAITAATPQGWTGPRVIALQMALQAYWVGGGLAGVAVASLAPAGIHGIEFALCALFITLTLDACRSRRQIPSLILGGLAFGVSLVLFDSQELFAAMVAFALMLGTRYLATVRYAMPARRVNLTGNGSPDEANPAAAPAGARSGGSRS